MVLEFIGWRDPEFAIVKDHSRNTTRYFGIAGLQYQSEQGNLPTYQTYENWIKSHGHMVPTSSTTPLISGGIAKKLKEAGFSDSMVDPLTKSGWTNTQVEEFLDGQQSITGLTAPRYTDPTKLIVIPMEQKRQLGNENSFLQNLPIGILGLGVMLAIGASLKD